MAKHLENQIVRFVGFSDLEGNPVNDWHDDYMNCAGMLCIYESEHKAPGKKFFYFYPNEPNSESQRYFNSISGVMTETNSEIIVEDGHRYVFEKGNFVSKEDFELLWLNVFARDPKTAKQVMDIVGGGYVYLS